MRARDVVLAAPLLMAFLAAAPSARAQDAPMTADERYEAGSKALGDNRFGEAALYFEAAAAMQPNPVTLFTAALAWEHAGFPDRACDDYARSIMQGISGDQGPLAASKVKTLEAVLGRVDVSAPGDGWFAAIDGNTEQPTPAQLHASPGVHALRYREPGKSPEQRLVYLDMGKTQHIELSPEAAAPEGGNTAPANTASGNKASTPSTPATTTREPEASSGATVRRTIGFVTIGVGAAALASGMVLGLQALDAKDAYIAGPTQPSFDHANALQNWTNIAFIAGGIFAAGGALLVWWPFKSGESKGGAVDVKTEDARLHRVPEPTRHIVLAPTLGGAMLRGEF